MSLNIKVCMWSLAVALGASANEKTTGQEPKLLTQARAAYTAAARGPAAITQTEYLRLADKQILDADRELKKLGDTAHVEDLAYLALRNVQIADVMAAATTSEACAPSRSEAGA